ncbi:SZRD1 protein, partial [Zapornia atra]|nr:SZRD1 protein [Zapornia atra]
DRQLEKKLKIMQKESRKSKSSPEVQIMIQNDSLPSGPPPQIQISERMTTNSILCNPNFTSRPAFPVKSLGQREAEDTDAREQTLGSTSPKEQEKLFLEQPTRISHPGDTRQPNNDLK